MIIYGDSVVELKRLEADSISAVVTDPPYGLGNTSPKNVTECLSAWVQGETWTPRGRGFMDKSWDAWVPPPELWREVFRVMRPGAHGLIFAGSRTQDLMSISLRLAGFEVRDTLQWLYGSGFPKSHNVSKGIDKEKGLERKVIGSSKRHGGGLSDIFKENGSNPITAPASPEAKQWKGWGTALKPAYEPIILIRKPLQGSVAQNVLEHGTGALNIDAARIGDESRWPANVLLDQESADSLEEQVPKVSRFFYCAKTSKAEREAGLKHGDPQRLGHYRMKSATGKERTTKRVNIHPTVKPIDLMRYLCRLITPPDGTILDPFAGSGSTGCAAALEGFKFIGIEREAEYVEIARARVAHYQPTVEPEDEPEKGEQLSLF